MSIPDTQPVEGTQQKRSKRHRMKRNKISAKARVDAARDFAVWAQEANRRYKAKLKPKIHQYL